MNKLGKDSAEVINLMTLFARLQLWCDDAPDSLVEFAGSDQSVNDLCISLSFAAHFLKMNERRSRRLFAAPVDLDFVAAWRNYEERYESVVAEIWLSDLFPELGPCGSPDIPKTDLQWDNADADAAEQAGGIEQAIEFAQFNADQDERWLDQVDFIERIQEGIAAWERLQEDTGFNLRGTFRRRAMVPFVLIPRKIANRHGSAEKLSMLKNLEQAHDAFVFGLSNAALALMRSILEAVLRDHYRIKGRDLNERIQNARRHLPRGANEAALQRLRRRANSILHLDGEKERGLPELDEVQMEKEIISLLFALRALIEGIR